MFGWQKDKKTSIAESPIVVPPQEPFEILLPDELMRNGAPDLRIASKFLALLAEAQLPSQHLEVFEGMPLINSTYQPIKTFLTLVNGAKQLQNFIAQVDVMLFKGRNPNAKGSLCCLIRGVFTEFEITELTKNKGINWQINCHIVAEK